MAITPRVNPVKRKNSEAFYHSLFDNMLDGLAYCQIIFDRTKQPIDFLFLKVNKNYEKLTGMKEVVGKKITDLIPGIKESNPEMFAAYVRVALTGRSERLEIYVKSLAKWFLISVYSPHKKHFVSVFQNITSQKQLEKDLENINIATRNIFDDLQIEKEALAYAKAKDEAMLESIGDGVIITDVMGKIVFMNKFAQDSLGFTIKETLHKLLFDVILIEDEKGVEVLPNVRPLTIALGIGATLQPDKKEYRDHSMVEDKTGSATYYYVRKDKTKFPVSITVAPVMLQHKIVGAVEIFRDITKEREIDKAKTEFVSLASHQLKTPPTAIKLLTERILRGNVGTFTPQQEEYLHDINSSNQRMIDLINALLNVSRLELGEFIIQLNAKNIATIVQDIFRELKSSLEKKRLRLEQCYPANATMVMIDETLFRMVISNLVTNAINYTDKGGIIKVECAQLQQGQFLGGKKLKENSFAIIITDNGCGIPKNQQDKLFAKFFRADNARIKHTDGTGLGLYIVKSILEKSSGSVWFTSKENEGAAFYVIIPMTGMVSKTGSKKLI